MWDSAMAELTLYTIRVGGGCGGCDHISKISSATTNLPPHAGLAGPPQLTGSRDQDLKTHQEVAPQAVYSLRPASLHKKTEKIATRKDKEAEGDGRKHPFTIVITEAAFFNLPFLGAISPV